MIEELAPDAAHVGRVDEIQVIVGWKITQTNVDDRIRVGGVERVDVARAGAAQEAEQVGLIGEQTRPVRPVVGVNAGAGRVDGIAQPGHHTFAGQPVIH